MKHILQQQKDYIQSKNFIISNQEKTEWYLQKVWIFRLSKYFSLFENRIENNEKIDFQEVINAYIFDKDLRHQCLAILEVIEVYLKNLLIFTIGDEYLNISHYHEKHSIKQMDFIYKKIFAIASKDKNIEKILKNNKTISSRRFFDEFSFGEARKFFENLKKEYKLTIAKEFWIKLTILENWLEWMTFLRNLCSHAENIFNKKMTHTLKGNFFDEIFWAENDNKFISYLLVLHIFKKSLIPQYNWEQGIIDNMHKRWISTKKFAEIKTTSPNEHNQNLEFWTEAWEVFVDTIYTKYVKKSNYF